MFDEEFIESNMTVQFNYWVFVFLVVFLNFRLFIFLVLHNLILNFYNFLVIEKSYFRICSKCINFFFKTHKKYLILGSSIYYFKIINFIILF